MSNTILLIANYAYSAWARRTFSLENNKLKVNLQCRCAPACRSPVPGAPAGCPAPSCAAQSLRIALPPLVNNVVSLLKDSSLAYVIGVVELSNIGNRIQAATFEPIPVFITVALIYLVLTTVMTQISGAIERRLDVDQRC